MKAAHIKLDSFSRPVIQSLEEHQQNVGHSARNYASSFDSGCLANIAGRYHDKGKEQDTFQNYILKVNGLKPINEKEGPHDHAFVGGLLTKNLNLLGHPFISNIIMGHHRGLYDDDELRLQLQERSIPDEIADQPLTEEPAWPRLSLMGKDLHHYVRMLFSCLVDADYLDTEAFMQPDQACLRGKGAGLDELLEQLETHLANLKAKSRESHVNQVRNYVQDLCREESNCPPGVFSMTVPTGGGKTLSSLLWALRHAVHNHQQRVIIAIPYTSIIEQTASNLKSIFGEENVLEHHSEFNIDDIKNDILRAKTKLATENWDYPIVVTTNVQLFESLFSNRPSACRKLHNIVNSVIILDEAQMLSVSYLRPIVDTLDTFSRVFGSSVLLTTASQPVLAGRIEGSSPLISFDGLPKVQELIPAEAKLHEKLRRVRLTVKDEPDTYDNIAAQVGKHDRVLCIVNTRADAREIFQRLPKQGRVHLSRMMCPAHIKKVLQQIKETLMTDQTLRVVSTQLIEAGVDIDFPVVYRQEAGLDSILQAAGRCNREGKMPEGDTFVFSLGKEHSLPRGYISNSNNARKSIKHYDDLFSPAAITDYFRQFYCRATTFDEQDMQGLLYMNGNQWTPKFESAASRFKLIDEHSIPVVVNYEDSISLVKRIMEFGVNYSLMKALGHFTVNVHHADFKRLVEAGAARSFMEGMYYVPSESFYKDEMGLVIDNQWLEETLIY